MTEVEVLAHVESSGYLHSMALVLIETQAVALGNVNFSDSGFKSEKQTLYK